MGTRDDQSDQRLLAALRAGDVEALRELLATDPGRAARPLRPFPGHPRGASPLGLVAMLRYDTATGDVTGFLEDADEQARLRALVMAADHQRLEVIDDLVAAGTPVDEADAVWGRHPLRVAAAGGRDRSVAHMLALGADPLATDGDGATALDLCRAARPAHRDQEPFARVEALLTLAEGTR